MALLSRNVAGYVDPNEVAGWVNSNVIFGYLTTVVVAVLVYDAGKWSSPIPLPMADIALESMHV